MLRTLSIYRAVKHWHTGFLLASVQHTREVITNNEGLAVYKQVFGKVIEGMDVVKKVEALGSQDGKPSKKVTVADSGELPAGTSSE